jgi:hypothetical protein
MKDAVSHGSCSTLTQGDLQKERTAKEFRYNYQITELSEIKGSTYNPNKK